MNSHSATLGVDKAARSSERATGFFAFHGLWSPGVRLMRAINLPVKATVIVVSLVVPLAMMSWFYWVGQTGQISFAQSERQGVAYHLDLLPVLKQVQSHRGLASRILRGDSAAESNRAQAEAALKAALDKLAATERSLGGDLKTATHFGEARTAIDEALSGWRGRDAGAAFELHTRAVSKLIELSIRVGDTSNLVLDPDLDSYYVMSGTLVNGVPLIEFAALARGMGAAALAGGSVSDATRLELSALRAKVAVVSDRQHFDIGKAQGANDSLKTAIEFKTVDEAVKRFGGLIQSQIVDGKGGSAEEFWRVGSEAVDGLHAVNIAGWNALDRLLAARIDRLSADRTLHISIAFVFPHRGRSWS